MLRSHYIPQFILRSFCEDGQIQYMDLSSKKVESRNTRSIFSEYGYYPEQLEHDLCDKIERDFAVVHKKIVTSVGKLTLSAAEMFLLKKFLLISVLRYRTDEKEDETILEQLSESEIKFIRGNFFENINKILNCKTKEEIFSFYNYEDVNTNLSLTAYAKDILGSYLIFVKSTDCGKEFLIPDKGNAWFMGRLAMEKAFMMYEMVMKYRESFFYQILSLLTPHDYTVFPLSKDMAVLCMSPFFKLMADNSVFTIPKNEIQDVLGFGNGYMLKPAKVSFTRDKKPIDYGFDVKPLCGKDVQFLNNLLLKNAESHIAFGSKDKLGVDL